VWWDILLKLYYKFTAKSVGERIVKIDQYLAKLESKNIVALFSGHGVVLTYRPTATCTNFHFLRITADTSFYGQGFSQGKCRYLDYLEVDFMVFATFCTSKSEILCGGVDRRRAGSMGPHNLWISRNLQDLCFNLVGFN